MIKVRKSADRGSVDHGWLKTKHSFSFSEYYDPQHMRFRMLRVINEDWVGKKAGFPKHAHQNMEIITYVISGALAHSDSLGNEGVIRAGEIQRMSAGSGIEHAEFNPSENEVCHLLQIWIFPDKKDIEPSWEQAEWKSRPVSSNGMRLLVSPSGEAGSAKIHQDTHLWHCEQRADQDISVETAVGRGGWLQLVRGSLYVAEVGELQAGDGLAVDGQETLTITAKADAEYLWFDLP